MNNATLSASIDLWLRCSAGTRGQRALIEATLADLRWRLTQA